MIKKILIGFMLFVIAPVFAAQWSQILPKTWYDISSLSYKGNIVRFWIKDLNPGDWDKIDNKQVWFYKREIEMDCTNKKLRFINNIAFDLKGNVIYNFSEPETKKEYDYGASKFYNTSVWTSIVPDSAGEDIYTKMCSLK